jgi:hypothetical protein
MQRGRLASLAPLSGVVSVVLIVVAFGPLGGSTPNTTDPVGKVANYYHSHYGREVAAAVIVLVAALFLVWFGVALRTAFIGRDPLTERLATVALVAGAMLATGASVLAGTHLALADSAHHGYLGALPALNALDNDLFPVLVVPLELLVLAIAAAALRYALFPRWVGWVSVVLFVAIFTPAAFFGLLLALVLLIGVSVAIYRWQGVAAAGGPVAPPPPAPRMADPAAL